VVFGGARVGYVFKLGAQGTGYYLDGSGASKADITSAVVDNRATLYETDLTAWARRGGEEYLYHGTDLNNIDSILNDDFSLTINPRHGCRFGKGIYFTNDFELALKYSEIRTNKKYVFVCKVYVGEICQGQYNMDKLPMNNNTGILFDTAVDSLNNPSQFIKFKNHQYLIIGLLEVDIFNKLHNKYIPQNKKEEHLRSVAMNSTIKSTTGFNSRFNSKLYFEYGAFYHNKVIKHSLSLYWLKPSKANQVGSRYKEVKLPFNNGCIFTNIGEKFIVKKKGVGIVNRIHIRKRIEHVKI